MKIVCVNKKLLLALFTFLRVSNELFLFLRLHVIYSNKFDISLYVFIEGPFLYNGYLVRYCYYFKVISKYF